MVLLGQGDAIELMEVLPDGCVDFLFTDPPYGTTRNKWDSPVDLNRFWQEARRVTKDNGCIAIWGQAPFSYSVAMAAKDIFRYEWVVEKGNAKGFLNAKKAPLRAHENVLIFYKKQSLYNPQKTTGHERKTAVRRNGTGTTNYGKATKTSSYDSTERYPRDIIKFSWDTQKSKLHPTQKPAEACRYFIATYTDPGMMVLDPFMGSGSTGEAAKSIGRDFIGFERDPGYFKVASDRIARAGIAGN